MRSLQRAAILAVSLLALVTAAFLIHGPLRSRAMYSRMAVRLCRHPHPEELSPLDAIQAGQKVKVGEEEDLWIEVTSKGVTGWLPVWYLSDDENDALPEIEPYLMVVAEDFAGVYLHPEAATATIAGLAAGRVVRVSAELRQWRYVDIAAYSIPCVMRGWMREDSLASPDEVRADEGRIAAGTPFYPAEAEPGSAEFGRLQAQETTYSMQVLISRRAEDMAYVEAAGGWSGWVAMSSIVHDPFGD